MAALLIITTATACTSNSSDHHNGSGGGKQVARATGKLAHALTDKDLGSITFQGSDTADRQFKKLVKPLHSAHLRAKTTGHPKVDGNRAHSNISMHWDIPGAKKPWTYTVTASWKRSGKTGGGHRWKPVWKPSLIHPKLTDGAKLRLEHKQHRRGKIIGANSKALVTKRRVVRVGIDKTQVSGKKAEASAKRLAKLVDISASDFVKRVASAGNQAFVQAIVFRADDDDLPSESKLDKIKGAVGLDDHAMLAPSKSFAAPILGTVGEATKEDVSKSKGVVRAGDRVGQSGLQSRYDDRLRGTPRITVRVVPPEHASSASPSASPSASSATEHTRKVFTSKGAKGKNLTISLDAKRQKRAEKLVDKKKSASSLVAIRPSTGSIVAAATNSAADDNNLATHAGFPPGSTFKIVSALALIRSGMKPSDDVSCPSHVTVKGRKFKNYNEYPSSKLGTINLKSALANSCNTAFIGLRHKVDSHDLNEAAESLGVGTKHDVGFPAYFGSIPKPKTATERAAEMIGQGRVQMSPMAMATIAASVQQGKTVVPKLVKGKSSKPKGKPLSATEAKQLKKMMGAVVDEGSGSALKGLEPPDAIAKTGTAEYGDADPPKTHAWMVGAQDDLAVSVFVSKGDSGSSVAGPIVKKFLDHS